MALLLLGVKTDKIWINDIAKIPLIGGAFLFVCMFVPAVILAFLSQAVIPCLNNDIGFTKAMLVLLPGWSAFLCLIKIKLYLFFVPSWILFGGIALVKGILLIAGIDDGQ